MNIPQDPYILLSFINTKLRDEFPSLDNLCLEMDIDSSHLKKVMSSIEYSYTEKKNQFTPNL